MVSGDIDTARLPEFGALKEMAASFRAAAAHLLRDAINTFLRQLLLLKEHSRVFSWSFDMDISRISGDMCAMMKATLADLLPAVC
ncbi:hypothetical protein OCH239_18925 [Roseivivax halodurans JCM 10272]|uniref:Uncharacterized protein n=1 Tax=Roseivivax halodurans JCM 10272 TaxID=1449350 RepID=X7E7D8_9RHOB|nr:hypothetical protein [Roseivivax halodurans]ETX11959.1 hypothetical protein OCH239_18925 [Roseivivax halodurans JCM 10272]